MRSPLTESFHRTCTLRPGRLPGTDRSDVGAGSAAASAVLAVGVGADELDGPSLSD
ncbi:hypothetical protein [Halorubrum halophilum]|uniref:hypothetical protein n=1 Tax=Halorubrum halophilum TaxID=413816 RepID=UPI0012AB9A58|nr:hypothetical protein [Halorubrum halophilum]